MGKDIYTLIQCLWSPTTHHFTMHCFTTAQSTNIITIITFWHFLLCIFWRRACPCTRQSLNSLNKSLILIKVEMQQILTDKTHVLSMCLLKISIKNKVITLLCNYFCLCSQTLYTLRTTLRASTTCKKQLKKWLRFECASSRNMLNNGFLASIYC